MKHSRVFLPTEKIHKISHTTDLGLHFELKAELKAKNSGFEVLPRSNVSEYISGL